MTYTLCPEIPEHICRAYDIRGIVETELSENVVYTLGLALGSIILERNHHPVLVARDGRLSGPLLMKALQAGLLKAGCHVVDLGTVPTPFLYFATHHLNIPNGIMLTGSHNPRDYNGLKIVIDHQVFCGDEIQNLSQRVKSQHFNFGQGILRSENIVEAYFERVLSDINLEKPLKVVVDCGNGVTGDFAPRLFEKLGCEVIPLFCEVDGNFPNHHPDPTQLENLEDLRAALIKHQADIGLAFDGDGDRLGVLTNHGELIWPDRQLMLHSKDILERNPGATVIFDVKCSRYLPTVIKESGGHPVMWKTGHSFIKSKMLELGALLGGEMSGHFFFKERWYGFDDGLYSAARLIEILSKTKKTLHELFSEFPNSANTPELKMELDDNYKFTFIEALIQQSSFTEGVCNTVDGLRVDFEDGWGLIRASNTTPCVIFRFEADNEISLSRVQQLFRDQVAKVDNTLELPF